MNLGNFDRPQVRFIGYVLGSIFIIGLNYISLRELYFFDKMFTLGSIRDMELCLFPPDPPMEEQFPPPASEQARGIRRKKDPQDSNP